jgi:hypothetical protein
LISVFYSQDSIANAEARLKDKQSKIVVDKGRIVKVSKDKSGIVGREVLTKNWTGDYIFENEWQSFRTRKDRKLELKSISGSRYRAAQDSCQGAGHFRQ